MNEKSKKYNQQYTLEKNITSHFSVLASFLPKGLTVEFKGKEYEYAPFSTFLIDPSFFSTWKCKSCGSCCRRYYLIWDKHTAEKFDWTGEKKESIKLTSGNTSVTSDVFYKEPDLTKEYCVLAYKKVNKIYCSEYERRPLLSRMPHTFTRRMQDSVKLIKRQFGRNWVLGCKAVEEPFSKEEFTKVDIPKLLFIKNVMSGYSFDTEVIDKIISVSKELVKRNELPDTPLDIGKVGIWLNQSLDKWLK